MKLTVEGQEPLVGTVKASGSKISAIHLIIASLFSNEDVILENVPRVEDVESLVKIIKSLGATAEWASLNALKINGSSISSNEISFDPVSSNVGLVLLVVPLIYRFGKAKVTKVEDVSPKQHLKNRFLNIWESLHFEIKDDGQFYFIEAKSQLNSEILLKVNTVTGTANAIFSSIFIPDETIITNASSEAEIDDLIEFLNELGGSVKRVDERKIIVSGTSSFGEARYKIMPDHKEAVVFATLALLTYGDITVENVVSGNLLAFVRKLEALGANFEFKENSLRVWRPKEQSLKATNVETAPCPGFLSDWQPAMTVLLTQVEGVSYVTETMHVKRLDFTKELNRMGGKVTLVQLAEEDSAQAMVEGPTHLKKGKVSIPDPLTGEALVLAALSAEGRSELYGYEVVQQASEGFEEKLTGLGAKIKVLE